MSNDSELQAFHSNNERMLEAFRKLRDALRVLATIPVLDATEQNLLREKAVGVLDEIEDHFLDRRLKIALLKFPEELAAAAGDDPLVQEILEDLAEDGFPRREMN